MKIENEHLLQDEAYDAHRDLLLAAAASGADIKLFLTAGNVILPHRHHWVVWTPWDSTLAAQLKAQAATPLATDGYVDQFVAENDPREQFIQWNERLPLSPRLFRFVRIEDVSGVSGVGHVADGVLWHDGSVTVHWRTEITSTAVYADLEAARRIHGHDGRTQVEWYEVMWNGPHGVVRATNDPSFGRAFTDPVRRALEGK